jgi:hypothetical protein
LGWERRQTNRYFYIGRRINGRVRKIYFGKGVPAAIAVLLDRDARAARRAAAAEVRAVAARDAELERAARALDAACDRLLEAHLLAAGYHCPGRRGWRRRHAHAKHAT